MEGSVLPGLLGNPSAPAATRAGHQRHMHHLQNPSRAPRSVTRATQQETQAIIPLAAQELTSESFAPFGQVIGPTHDGKEFDDEDAQLRMGEGVPRLYIMTLPNKGMTFDRITHHARVTQCLCGLGPDPWQSVEQYPRQEDLTAFRIAPSVFVKLHQSTWHAGPFFRHMSSCNFANLELADTNVSDHNTHVYSKDSTDVNGYSIDD